MNRCKKKIYRAVNSVNKKIRFKTSLLRSDLCDYSDACIVAKGEITVEGDNNAKKN